ncbi:hypothetical protein C8R42DRAFT_171641 [Lentinula raphanica]|nr:hypothetical protein C8R42DRAFT_171641 [Lentinula raphanica]
MSNYDFLLWFTSNSPAGNLSSSTIPNFSETHFEVLRVKWNRCRRQVPHSIYNGAIFDWIEGALLSGSASYEEDKALFCLELAGFIGSPEFLHRLLESNGLNLASAHGVPPFGLGYLVSCEIFRGEMKVEEWLDAVLGDVLCGGSGGDDDISAGTTLVKALYSDWLRWKRHQHELNHASKTSTTASVNSTQVQLDSSSSKRKRPLQPDADTRDEVGTASNIACEPPFKRPKRSHSSLPQLAVKSRSGLLQWLTSSTTPIQPQDSRLIIRNKENLTQKDSHKNAEFEDPSGWIWWAM